MTALAAIYWACLAVAWVLIGLNWRTGRRLKSDLREVDSLQAHLRGLIVELHTLTRQLERDE